MWYREIFVTSNRVCAIIIFNFSTSTVLVCSGTLHIPGFLCQIERIYLWKVNLIHFPLFDSTCIYFVSCFLLHFSLILSLFCSKTMSVTFCFQTFTSIDRVATTTQSHQRLSQNQSEAPAPVLLSGTLQSGWWYRCCSQLSVFLPPGHIPADSAQPDSG